VVEHTPPGDKDSCSSVAADLLRWTGTSVEEILVGPGTPPGWMGLSDWASESTV